MTQSRSKVPNADVGSGFRVKLTDVSFSPSRHSFKPVLNHISLEIEPGEFVAVIGSNAAGKSALLKAIAGELPKLSGEVKVGGKVIEEPVNRTIDGVGIVHQFDDSDLIEHLSIAQNIAIRQLLGGGHKLWLFAITKRWRRAIAQELGSNADFLNEDLDILVRNLAGGKRQMLSVVIAIYLEHKNNPCRLLLLDEHTSRLDHINATKVMKYTASEIRRIRTTALMVTHRYIDAKDYADRILVILDGAIYKDIKNPKEVTIEQLNQWVEGREN
jgi:putative tryptophan/tyrosine transport system ATP-binding protein